MKQRYWYDLSNIERDEIIKKWESSEWYYIIKRKYNCSPSVSAGVFIIYLCFGLIIAVGLFATENIIAGTIAVAITIILLYYNDKSYNENVNKINEEFAKWLLEKYNIKM